MASVDEDSTKSAKNGTAETGLPSVGSEKALTGESEDIQIIDEKNAKYLEIQNRIRAVITDNKEGKDALIEDIVDAISKLSASQTYLNIITFGTVPIMNHFRRKKLKKVIENILIKIFDATLDWYVMDYEDLKQTCDYVGGKNCFKPEDHRYIYTAVIQKLKQGPIRDKCIELGITDFVNEKLIDIRNNYFSFKMNDL